MRALLLWAGPLLVLPSWAAAFETPAVAALDSRAAAGAHVEVLQSLDDEMAGLGPDGLMELGELLRIGLREAPPLRRPRPDLAQAIFRRAASIPGSHQAKALYEAAKLTKDPTGAATLFGMSGALGYPAAMRAEADALLAAGDPASDMLAERLLRLALGRGEAEAAFALADLVVVGRAEGDAVALGQTGRAMLSAAADDGEASSMADLAELLEKEGQADEAATWLRRAASLEHVGANMALGDMALEQGDTGEAVRYFLSAAQAGAASGALALAEMQFVDGHPVPDAVRWLELAISVDHLPSILLAARMAKDAETARPLVDRAELLYDGNSVDALKIARIFHPERGVMPDPARARIWLERAAAGDRTDAKATFGAFLLEYGGSGDLSAAIEMLEAAGEGGKTAAWIDLGDHYARGDVPDLARATGYYRRAIEEGSVAARDRLASLLYVDTASEAARAEAVKLWREAAADGHLSAMTKLGRTLIAEAGGPEQAGPEVIEEAATLLELAAREGNASAMAELADILASEALGAPRLDLAREWLRRSADAGRTSSLVTLARTHIAAGDAARAVEIFEEAAEKGSVHSMVELARAYTLGIGTDPDIERGSEWLRRADAKGVADPRTLEILGRGYLENAGAPGNVRRGLELLERAADLGNVRSMLRIARIYSQGDLIAPNAGLSLDWYRRAADAGNVTAMIEIGRAYAKGELVPEDRAEAFRWLRRAIDSGSENTQALIAIGQALTRGVGAERDTQKGFEFFERAAQKGNVRAMELVAVAYQTGLGVTQDPAKAVPWYSRAASLGSVSAMVELGQIYASGYGTTVDPERAFQYFQDAADRGSGAAMRDVGRFLLSGNGLAPQPEAGLAWFYKAADQGDAGAMIELASIYQNGYSVPRDPAEAAKWMERAVELDSTDGKYMLGKALIEGDGVTPDRERAIDLLREATAEGEPRARRYLRYNLQPN